MKLDKREAAKLLKQAAKSAPDFIYREHYGNCEYVVRDLARHVPSCCIVGEVALLAGVDRDDLADVFGTVDHKHTLQLFDDRCDLQFTDGAVRLLRLAQEWQDGFRVTWSEAVKLAFAGVSALVTMGPITDARPAVVEVVGRQLDSAHWCNPATQERHVITSSTNTDK